MPATALDASTSAPSVARMARRWHRCLHLLLALLLLWLVPAAAQSTTQITFVSPTDGAVFDEPAQITLSTLVVPGVPGWDCSGDVDYSANGKYIGDTDLDPYYSVVWEDVPAGHYTLTAHAVLICGAPFAASGTIAPKAIEVVTTIEIDVRDPFVHAALGNGAPALEFTPGVEVALPVIALNTHGEPVAAATLAWQVEAMGSAQPTAACVDDDQPSAGTLTTDAGGHAMLRFVPGCANATRRITITPPLPSTQLLVLDLTRAPPPPPTVYAELANDAPALEFVPGVEMALPIVARNTNGALVAGAILVWQIETMATQGKAGCVDDDQPSGGSLMTGANGRAMLRFVPGCADGSRRITITPPPPSTQLLVVDLARGAVPDLIVHAALGAAAPPLVATPGVEVALPIVALDVNGERVAAANLAWQVQAEAASTQKAGCVDHDQPAGGSLTTDALGQATLRFVPGCASGNRRVTVTPPPPSTDVLTLLLRGPDQRSVSVVLTSGESILIVPPEVATAVSFTVKDGQDQPIGGSTLDFVLAPAAAGTIDATLRSADDGTAVPTLTLRDSALAATLTACVRDRSDVCVQVPIRNRKAAIEDPAEAIVWPLIQQSLDTPLVQFDNIGGHLRSLRSGAAGSGIAINAGNGSVPVAAGQDGQGSQQRFNVFVAGSVDMGKRDPVRGRRNGFEVSSRGLTLGADWRLTPGFVVGAALGGMRADTDVDGGGRQRAHGGSGSLYGQWLPYERAYVSAALNVGGEDFDLRRPGCGAALTARTASTHRALMIEAGYSLAHHALRFTPYLRYQRVNASLDAFTEQGACNDRLSISGTSMSRATLGAGANIDRAFSTRSGVWIPSLAVEYQADSQNVEAVFARLMAGGPSVVVPLEKPDRRYGTARLALTWMTSLRAQPISAFVGFDTGFGRSDYRSRALLLGVRVPL